MSELASPKEITRVPIAEWSQTAASEGETYWLTSHSYFYLWLIAIQCISGAVQELIGKRPEFWYVKIVALTFIGLTLFRTTSKKRRKLDPSLLDDPEDPLEKLVRLEILQGEQTLGDDFGVLRVDQDSLCFVGKGTSFCVGAGDLIRKHGKFIQPVDIAPVEGALRFQLRHYEGDITLKFWPIPKNRKERARFGHFAHALEESHRAFAEAALALPESGPTANLERVFPPVTKRPYVPPTPIKPDPINYGHYAIAAAVGIAIGLVILPKWSFVLACSASTVFLFAAIKGTIRYRNPID